MEKYLVKTVNNIEADSTGNVDGNALGFIPLSGTEVGKPVTGDIEITDFNKGVILTAPNSSRYRITVDNAGNLITTLIP